VVPIFNTAYIASGSHDKTIKIWDITSGKEFRSLTGHFDSVNSVTSIANTDYIISGSDD